MANVLVEASVEKIVLLLMFLAPVAYGQNTVGSPFDFEDILCYPVDVNAGPTDNQTLRVVLSDTQPILTVTGIPVYFPSIIHNQLADVMFTCSNTVGLIITGFTPSVIGTLVTNEGTSAIRWGVGKIGCDVGPTQISATVGAILYPKEHLVLDDPAYFDDELCCVTVDGTNQPTSTKQVTQ